MSDAFDLLLPFDTDEPQFARGFEAGRLWTLAQNSDAGEVRETIHAANAEMAIRIAEATGRSFTAQELSDEWVEITFGEQE